MEIMVKKRKCWAEKLVWFMASTWCLIKSSVHNECSQRLVIAQYTMNIYLSLHIRVNITKWSKIFSYARHCCVLITIIWKKKCFSLSVWAVVQADNFWNWFHTGIVQHGNCRWIENIGNFEETKSDCNNSQGKFRQWFLIFTSTWIYFVIFDQNESERNRLKSDMNVWQ